MDFVHPQNVESPFEQPTCQDLALLLAPSSRKSIEFAFHIYKLDPFLGREQNQNHHVAMSKRSGFDWKTSPSRAS